MRMLVLASALAFITTLPLSTAPAAEGCTGPDCSQQGQGGGHDCERKKDAPSA